jgi:hypothetical protein
MLTLLKQNKTLQAQTPDKIPSVWLTLDKHPVCQNSLSQVEVDQIVNDGYAFAQGSRYPTSIDADAFVALTASWYDLSEDPTTGCRSRGNGRFVVQGKQVIRLPTLPYRQKRTSNNLDGGAPRDFPNIPEHIWNNSAFQHIMLQHIAQAGQVLGDIQGRPFNIHLIRYCGSAEHPSFPSPIELHKDDEAFVLVCNVATDQRVIGGDNLISIDRKAIDRVVSLRAPLDTLFLTRACFHGVTPVASADHTMVNRDVILFTLENPQMLCGADKEVHLL